MATHGKGLKGEVREFRVGHGKKRVKEWMRLLKGKKEGKGSTLIS